jgi:hypothetical protein
MTGTVHRRANTSSIPAVELPIGLEYQGSTTVTNTASVMPLPPGHYESIAMDRPESVLTLGVPGVQYPVHYQIDSLAMVNGGRINLVGPVVLTFAENPESVINLENNMIIGNPEHPEWLDLRMYSGNLRIANNGTLYGKVTAPNGSVHFDNNAQFTGGVAAKYFTMSNNTEGVVFNVSFQELLSPW